MQDEILRNAVERFNGKNWKKIGNILKLTILQLHYHVKQIKIDWTHWSDCPLVFFLSELHSSLLILLLPRISSIVA